MSRRGLHRVGGKCLVREEPKAERSRRTLALPAHLVEALRTHRAAQLEERVTARPLWEDHDLVFPQANGRSIEKMPSARALTFLASEVLHHARIALDYCAYQAVWLDGGSPRDSTKFPLVRVAERWGKEKRNSLPGITPEHAQWIKAVQPFEGVDWSRNLLELSNRDKHQMAAEVVPIYRCKVDRSRIYVDPLGDPQYCGFAVTDTRLELTIAPAMTQATGGQASSPLEETLFHVMRGVTDLVNRFLTEAGYTPVSLTVDERPQATSGN